MTQIAQIFFVSFVLLGVSVCSVVADIWRTGTTKHTRHTKETNNCSNDPRHLRNLRLTDMTYSGLVRHRVRYFDLTRSDLGSRLFNSLNDIGRNQRFIVVV